jgi:four helix bundle protein
MKQQATQSKVTSFRDLHAWQKGHALAINIYTITQDFPSSEQFGLTNQIRRSSVSVTSNIAEGFSRKSRKDKQHFYQIALGSLTELQSQLDIAHDINYLNKEIYVSVSEMTDVVHKLLNGLIKSAEDWHV